MITQLHVSSRMWQPPLRNFIIHFASVWLAAFRDCKVLLSALIDDTHAPLPGGYQHNGLRALT